MANGKRYYWLKLHDDFFNSKRIKKLRKMAGGDTYTIIYLKMQLLSIKNDGVITFSGLEDNIADELALDLDESPDDVRVTLAYLLSCGLAETKDEINFFLPYAVSNTGSETAAAQRMREMRERNNVTPMLQTCYGEKEIEIDTRDIDREIARDRGAEEGKTPGLYTEEKFDWNSVPDDPNDPYARTNAFIEWKRKQNEKKGMK